VLKTSSWRVSVLIQTERRIGRRYPHSDRRIIRCYCLRCSSSAIHPAHLQNGPSVHPTVPTSDFAFCAVDQVHRHLLLGYRRFIRRCLFFFFPLSFLTLENRLSSQFDMWYFGILGPRNVYKDMLNNMVSPIDHVVMTHQNQIRIANGAMFTTEEKPLNFSSQVITLACCFG
jgi:hypothetical protein